MKKITLEANNSDEGLEEDILMQTYIELIKEELLEDKIILKEQQEFQTKVELGL